MPAFALDFDAVRTALVQALIQGVALDQNHVIASEPEQGAVRPSRPYISFKITSPAARYGSDALIQTSDPAVFLLCGPRAMTCSFQAFGRTHEEAYGLLATWQAALDAPTLQETLGAAGLSVFKPGSVTDLSQLLSTGFEGRAQMDVIFGIESLLRLDVGTIESVDVAGVALAGFSLVSFSSHVEMA